MTDSHSRKSPKLHTLVLTLCMLSPFSPIHWLSSALTLLVEYALTAPNEIVFSFHSTLMDFHHPGLVAKIRTKRIHPGSCTLDITKCSFVTDVDVVLTRVDLHHEIRYTCEFVMSDADYTHCFSLSHSFLLSRKSLISLERPRFSAVTMSSCSVTSCVQHHQQQQQQQQKQLAINMSMRMI